MSELFKIDVNEYKVLGKLPDPFLKPDGTRVATKEEWEEQRKEIFKTAVELQYGILPPNPEFVEVEPTFIAEKGKGSTYIVHTGTRENPLKFRIKVFLPKTNEPCPVVIDGDGCFDYAYDKEFYGSFLNNNIAFVLFDRTELAHDIKSTTKDGAIYKTYTEEDGYTYGAIGAWAWAYSRVVDALMQLDIVDTSFIAFTGHSRGGKTAMLAGVLDNRATIVNPNETCQGSCSCYRIFMKAINQDGDEIPSERLKDLVTNFPYWMGKGLNDYIDKPEELPFDSHYLKALVAPRVLLDTEAGSDIWANPIGTWQTTMAAKEVYKFLGCEENLYWNFRNGTHLHKVEDVQKLVNVIKHIREGEPLSETFFKTPFDQPELIFDWRSPK